MMFARTERLLLRPGWAEDAPALAKAIGDEAIVRNLAKAPWPYTLDHARQFLATERAEGECSLLVFRRTNRAPQLIGSAGIGRDPNGHAELGYWIARSHWGLGYATEAAAAIVAIARHAMRMQRLHAGHFLDNPASGRVLEKVGFKPTGIVAPRFSAGRDAEAPCRLFELQFDANDAEVQTEDQTIMEPACRMMAA
jgi:RimJ/RimL family protein N-acetyltransferase